MTTVGVFDSGVGGVAVLLALHRLCPAERLLYYADQAHFPYGERGADDVRALTLAAGGRLVGAGAELVVIACNTASSAALPELRERLPVPVVGIEPAVKPACALTRRGRIGVLATSATARGTALANLIERVAGGVEVIVAPAPGLVEAVEGGLDDRAAVEAVLAAALSPLQAAAVDVVVLGCTHFAFVRRDVQRLLGPGVAVLEPAESVALQAARALRGRGLGAAAGPGEIIYTSSGDATKLAALAASLAPLLDPHPGMTMAAPAVPYAV